MPLRCIAPRPVEQRPWTNFLEQTALLHGAGGIALRLDGAAGADGGFEDVSKPDGQAQTPE
ncbi:MAG TPA: hypothetical protein VMV89_11885 [Candidatus Paceibacterota bacterium]|nr:hypothetical protein [Candidatus Paceibacterota bacterium]